MKFNIRVRRRAGERKGWVLAGLVVTIVIVSQLASHELVHVLFGEISTGQELLLEGVFLAVVDGFFVWQFVIAPLERRRSLADFDARLGRAFEMAPTEQQSYDVVHRVLGGVPRARRAELLVADSSDAHLKSVAAVGNGPGCQVVAPHNCPAVRRSQSLVFDSGEQLDTCPHLRDRPGCAAVCVPVNIMGKAVGVLHVVSEAHSPATKQISKLESLAGQAGTRIGMLRIMDRTSLQASVDPLTGLLNRRAFENQASVIVDQGRPFALAMADLDHFKQVNDVHGHESGDRALRAFARTLQASVRADDLVCRYGGEEFVVFLPGLTAAAAVPVLERIQAELKQASESGNQPRFTASFGLADSTTSDELHDVVRAADLSLLQSKRDGRNRITLASPPLQAVPDAV